MLSRHKKWYTLSVIISIVWAIETSLTPYVLKYIIDKMRDFQGEASALTSYIMIPVVVYIGLWLIRPLYFRLWDYKDLYLQTYIRRDVTMYMFDYLLGHSHDYFQNHFAGSLQNKIDDLNNGTIKIIKQIAEESIGAFLMVLIAIGTLTVSHPLFGGILALWVILFTAIFFTFLRKIMGDAETFSKARNEHVGNLMDSLTNMSNIRLFSRQKYEHDRMLGMVENTSHKDRKMQWALIKVKIVWDVTIFVMMVSMMCSLIFMYSKGQVTIGDFSLVIMITISVFQFLWWYLREVNEALREFGKCKQALTILNTRQEVVDKPNAHSLQVTQGAITFENVTFGYANKKGKQIFKHKNVRINPGEKVGLVGFSGGGKTSFVNLILRLFDIQEGKITIDGQDISTVTQQSLREQIAMLPQDTSLFHRSLMENIRYGNPLASDETVIEVSKRAFCHEFIETLPEKYDTLVGERGTKLSGGQRQRIAVARAILKDAPILILDEATSALDSVTEDYLQKSLTELMKGRTTIVIAHRLSTLANMDRILVFEKGKIIEEGTHDQLLIKNGTYKRMWSMQAGGFMPHDASLA